MTERLQAMILAAGLSTRMRPLTLELPKILLPVVGKSHLQRNIDYLQTQDISSIAINVFHGKDLLKKEIKLISDQIKTFEEDPIRGTGGGILGMKSFITEEHFVVMNCDFVTDLNILKMFEFHLKNKALATLFLPRFPPKAKYNKVSFDSNQQIQTFKAKNSQNFFGGIHIMSKKIFDDFPKDHHFCIVKNVYEPLLEKGEKILAYTDPKARWFDLGELHLYLRSLLSLVQKPLSWMTDIPPDTSWIHESVELFGDVTSRNVIIEKNSRINEGTLIENSIVFPGTRVKSNEYRNTILTPEYKVQI